MAVFEGYQIVLDLTTSVKFKDKTQIRKDITSNGGVVSFIVSKKSTHVICNDAEKADISYKCRMAAKYGLPIVSMDWIKHCIEKGALLGTDDYLVAGKSKSDSLKEGKISATRFQKTEKKKSLKPYINMNKFQVWKPEDNNCPKFSSDYQLAKYAVFINEKMGKKSQMFTVLEVHVDESFSSGNSVHDFKYRVTSHSGAVRQVEKGESGSFEYRFCSNVDEVLGVYSFLYKQEQQHGMTLTHNAFSQHIGSEKFRLIAGELGIESGSMNEEVSDLVELVWHETLGKLEAVLSVPVSSIKMEQIEKAEAILKQIKSAVDSGDSAKTAKLMADFYNNLPHENRDVVNDVANVKAWLSRKNDTCQLVKDMISVSEATNWSIRSSTQSKYKALRCVVDCLSKSSSEYDRVHQHLMSSLSEKSSLQVQSIYAVNRPVENVNFMHEVSNKQELFHASKVDNIVGILSRGLLMPKVVVDDHGGVRSDPGMLGSGIYFASSASTSIQYSTPSKTKGSRFMLVCEVALGNTKEMYQKDLTLTSPPEGYQSVHGVKSTNGMKSAFKDDEFVIYNTAQQRIKYLVEFTTDADTIKMVDLSINVDNQDEIEDDDNETLSLTDVKGIIDPMSKVKAGLVSKDDTPVNLKSVHIRAKLMDLASEVIVLQEYENNSKSPLEAKYVFPLGDMAAVCGFEAFINGKHIVGEVKEKETAHKEYKKAISEGHGAYLMDQDEETPDVFTVSVGNLPAGASVLIKITYVAELQAEGDMISFRLPGSVAPWKKDSLKVETQQETDTIEVEQGETSVQVSIDMPFDIRSIECPTHKIKSKRTLTKATVEMLPEQTIDDGFHLFIGLAEIHVPRMWVERKPGDFEQQACMLTFYPEFEACETDDVSIILMLDLSNSMKGDNLVSAKKILLLTLQQLPPSWNFNIVVFGTAWRELFPSCVTNTTLNRKLASEFVMNVSATMGNTEVVRPMHCLYLLKPETFIQNVFIVSDGHLNNPDVMMKSARDNSQHTRIFTLGIGATADRHLLRNLARGAAGAFEFFDSKSKSKWEGKVRSQIHKAAQPGLTSVMVHWEQHGADVPAPVQAPSQITALFNGSRSVIYGYVPNCTMATLTARIGSDEVSTMVSTSDLSITEGNILHRLTAKALIGDWEDGVLSPDRTDHEIMKMNTKQFIIELSKEYSIVTQFTSFVAIEKRDEDEERHALDAPSMWELIELENVDQLQYMGYKEDDMLLEPELVLCKADEVLPEPIPYGNEEMEEANEMLYMDAEEIESLDESLDEPVMLRSLAYTCSEVAESKKKRSSTRLGKTRVRGREETYRSRSPERAYKKPRSRSSSRERTNKNQAKTPQEYKQYDEVTSVQKKSMQEQSMRDEYLDDHAEQKLDLYEEIEPLMGDTSESVDPHLGSMSPMRMESKVVHGGGLALARGTAASDDSSSSPSLEEEYDDIEMDCDDDGVMGFGGHPSSVTHDDEKAVEESSDDEDNMVCFFGNDKEMPPSDGANKTDLTHDAFGTAVEGRQEDLTVLVEKGFDETPVRMMKFKKKTRRTRSLKEITLNERYTEPETLTEDLKAHSEFFTFPRTPVRQLARTAYQPQEKLQRVSFGQSFSKPTKPSANTSGYTQYQHQRLNMKQGIITGGSMHAPPPPPSQCTSRQFTPTQMDCSLEAALSGKRFAAQQSAAPSGIVASSAPPPPSPAFAPTSGFLRDYLCSSMQPQVFAQSALSAPPPPPPPSAPLQSAGYSSFSMQPQVFAQSALSAPPRPPPPSAPLPSSGYSSFSMQPQFLAQYAPSAPPPPPPPPPPQLSALIPPPPLPRVDSFSPLPPLSPQPPQPMVKLMSKGRKSGIMLSSARVESAATGFVRKVGSEIQREVQFSDKNEDTPSKATCVVNSAAVSPPVSWRVESEVTSKRKSLKVHGGKKAKLTSRTGYLDRTDLAMYGIGINIPSISKASGLQLEIKNIASVISMQEMRGSWVMDRKLQELLGIDFVICKGALDKAGLKSLGTKCYDEIIELISTTIVVLCIIYSTVPEVFPTNFRHEKAIEDVLKKFQNAISKLNIQEHTITQAVFLAIDFCQKIDEKYPLVCTQLELGQNWTEFAGKLLQLNSNAETSPEVWLGADLAGVSNETCQLELYV